MMIRILSKLSNDCAVCKIRDKCNHKKMVACALLEYQPIMPNIQPIQAPLLRKQDLRNIRLDKDTEVTIDLEELREQMKKDFYKSINSNFREKKKFRKTGGIR